jgi:hypothetical protein
MQMKSMFKVLTLALAVQAPAVVLAAEACDRACLEGFVDKYLDAVVAHKPSAVPIAPNAKFTEDGQRLVIGDGLWNTMKAKGTYRLFVTDVPAGQVAFVGTIAEDHRDADKSTGALIALRLKVENKTITQIEQIVVRNEMAAANVEKAGSPRPAFLKAVPAASRMSRADLIKTANKYFTGMQNNDGKGDYPFADDCNRFENGGLTTNAPLREGQTRPDPKTSTNYSANWSCMEQFKSGLLHFVHRIRDRRFVAVDEERGIVFAFGFFDHTGGTTRTFQVPDGRTVTAGPVQPWTWQIAELFKVEGGKLHEIEAILQRSPYGMNSGWSTWEQGMSDQMRDVTKE